MAEWRFLHTWTEDELAARVAGLARLASTAPTTACPHGYRHYVSEASIAHEPAGSPIADGAFARAEELVALYAFSDPSIVTAHFDHDAPLSGRRMLLELHAVGLRFLCGVAVAAVRSDASARRSVFGYRYDTLEGHIEAGSEWFVLTKDHASGDVRFRIEAVWREGEFPNAWSQLGFQWLGPHYQRAWHRAAYLRLREMLSSHTLPSLPAHGRLVHEGPRLEGAAAARVAHGSQRLEVEIEDELRRERAT